MNVDENQTDLELAAADLDAAAADMVPYLERIEGLIALMDANNGDFPSNPPPEFLIRIDDLFAGTEKGVRSNFKET
ncbi:hypothetical protein [Gimesia panareensis]|uniref:hypothetical protein n=1 Tax=Gimesia panareensis TaxID=2527978 RepID=UPI00118C013F|nr:hypothetical protein [Gimesia panareensis]QDU49468.1 hypothetical protein Pan110_18050 [Gimesia panareensis]